MPIVQAAIGNLLRNAIENSDRGEITIRLDTQRPWSDRRSRPRHDARRNQRDLRAHGARRRERDGGGIGLDLISRLCEHLGWKLTFDSQPQRGTTARLDFRPRGSD